MGNLHDHPKHNNRRPCEVCRKEFDVHPRLGERQRLCGAADCRKIYLRIHRRSYRQRNIEAEKSYQEKLRDSRPKDFWRKYRELHADYREREKSNARVRKRRNFIGSQRQLDIPQAQEMSVESGDSSGSQRQHVGLSDAPAIEQTATEPGGVGDDKIADTAEPQGGFET